MKVLFTLPLSVLLYGCTFQSLTDTCKFPSKVPLYETQASSMRMLVAWPHSREKPAPLLSLDDADGAPVLTVGLVAVASDSVVVTGAAMPGCGLAETYEYSLVVDAEDWASYWRMASKSGRFSGGMAMPGVDPVVRSNSAGFGLADKQTGEFHWVCGCLAI